MNKSYTKNESNKTKLNQENDSFKDILLNILNCFQSRDEGKKDKYDKNNDEKYIETDSKNISQNLVINDDENNQVSNKEDSTENEEEKEKMK